MKLSKIYKAYIAGFVDGEGCIRVHREPIIRGRRKTLYYCLTVGIANTRLGILKKLNTLYGGHLCLQSRGKDTVRQKIWNWKVCGKNAGIFLLDIYKYLIIKKQEAKKGIEFYKLKLKFGHKYRNNRFNKKEIKIMDRYYILLKNLKQRGKNG